MRQTREAAPSAVLSDHDDMLHALDAQEWSKRLKKLPNEWRIVFLSDTHLPDYDPRAWDVALKVTQAAKPHVVPHGSDALDFSTVSTKWPSTVRELAQDAWRQSSSLYRRLYKEELRDAAPDAINPFLVGNHDLRAYTWIVKHAPQFTDFMSHVFVDLIRECGGLWLGIDAIEIELEPYFLLAHGHQWRASEAKAIGTKTGWTHNILSAHIHRQTHQPFTGRHGTMHIHTVGCLCNLIPAYLINKGQGAIQNWHHGLMIVDVNRKRQTVDFQPVPINQASGRYYARWGDQEFHES